MAAHLSSSLRNKIFIRRRQIASHSGRVMRVCLWHKGVHSCGKTATLHINKDFLSNENVAFQETREGAVESELNELELYLFSIQVQVASCCDLELLVARHCCTKV